MQENSNPQFNHFKLHTQYSICEGAIKIDDLKDFCKQNKILISDEWKKILERSPNAVDEKSLKKYRKVNNLKSIFMIICRRIIHNLIFFLPLKSIVYRAFDVRPNLFLRRLFRINS